MEVDYKIIALELIALVIISSVIYHVLYLRNKNKLRTKGTNYLVYHDNCLDGFMSAMVAFEEAKERGINKLIVVPANYSDEPVKAISGDTITMVDFSYRSEVLKELLDNGVTITIIDHHEKAIDDINKNLNCRCNFSQGIFTSLLYRAQPHINIRLADNRSRPDNLKEAGCAVSYNSTTYDVRSLLGIEMVRAVSIANRHDLWLHDGDETDDASFLSSWFKNWSKEKQNLRELMKKHPKSSKNIFKRLLNDFNKTTLDEKLSLGEADVEDDMLKVVNASEFAMDIKFLPEVAPANSENLKIAFIPKMDAYNISMLGSFLVKKKGYDIAVMYVKSTDKGEVYSMRSNQHTSNIDVASICEDIFTTGIGVSGGGHRNAAGTVVPVRNTFFEVVK